MHGVKRVDPATVSEEARKAKQLKILKYKHLRDTAWKMRAGKTYSREALRQTAKLLDVNPEFYSLWNYRREILLFLRDTEDMNPLYEDELQVIVRALHRNPKSYCAWYHRVWVVERGDIDLTREIELTASMLELDARNFHCWDYRRFVIAKAGVPAEVEFEFTTKKIQENFSNYSAWHYRSKLLPILMQKQPELSQELLDNEFKMVENAFYTEPDDQSAWLYHRWILGEATSVLKQASNLNSAHSEPTAEVDEKQMKVLFRELHMCQELLSLEPNCRWALLAIAVILFALYQLESAPEGTQQRISEVFERLPQLDPLRATHYRDVFASLGSIGDRE